MAGEALHEDRETLGPDILDRHRAISTIMEELEAIDWYDQRIKASGNAELQAVLRHNRNEEKEHCSMLLEWLRRHDRRARHAPTNVSVQRRTDPRGDRGRCHPGHWRRLVHWQPEGLNNEPSVP